MGYYVEIQKNPHDNVGPCHSQGDASNVTTLQFDDDGDAAELLHELIGFVVARGENLHAEEASSAWETVDRLRDRLDELEPDNDVEEPDENENDDAILGAQRASKGGRREQ